MSSRKEAKYGDRYELKIMGLINQIPTFFFSTNYLPEGQVCVRFSPVPICT